jgi:hypothetical protein
MSVIGVSSHDDEIHSYYTHVRMILLCHSLLKPLHSIFTGARQVVNICLQVSLLKPGFVWHCAPLFFSLFCYAFGSMRRGIFDFPDYMVHG